MSGLGGHTDGPWSSEGELLLEEQEPSLDLQAGQGSVEQEGLAALR